MASWIIPPFIHVFPFRTSVYRICSIDVFDFRKVELDNWIYDMSFKQLYNIALKSWNYKCQVRLYMKQLNDMQSREGMIVIPHLSMSQVDDIIS